MTRVAVVGTGRWGINHVRTFARDPKAELTYVCDTNDDARKRALASASSVVTVAETALFEHVLEAKNVDAVVIATPAVTHADLAIRALECGKHVLVEKPLALTLHDAQRVAAAAKEADRVLMIGHLMLYHPAVEFLRDLVVAGELGDLFYLYASRLNLGRLRTDENALWSLAPHDFSMIDYFLQEAPVQVTAHGHSYVQESVEDVVFSTLTFASGQIAHVHVSWLDPHKTRQLTLVGSEKMATFDDMSQDKIRIHAKGYERPLDQGGSWVPRLHQGDSWVPYVNMQEPLACECRHFLACIETGEEPRTGVESALRVVSMLEAAQLSLKTGNPVP